MSKHAIGAIQPNARSTRFGRAIRVIAQSHPKPQDGFGDLHETVRKMTSMAFSGFMFVIVAILSAKVE
jgi:hypothetical protein